MSVYMTEEEQLESIKKWWGRYGNMITIALSIVLLIVAGIRYYDWHHAKVTQQASNIYEKMMNDYSSHEDKALRSYANELIKEYGSSVYADVAHLTLAKLYVAKGRIGAAKEQLQAVITKSKMSALKQIAKIRMARLLTADKDYDKALQELSAVDDKAYLPLINELKGDIHSARGQYQEAISAYRLAIDEVKSNGMANLFLEMKTNELASKAEANSTVNNKTQAA